MRPDGESRQGRRNTTCIQQHMRTNLRTESGRYGCRSRVIYCRISIPPCIRPKKQRTFGSQVPTAASGKNRNSLNIRRADRPYLVASVAAAYAPTRAIRFRPRQRISSEIWSMCSISSDLVDALVHRVFDFSWGPPLLELGTLDEMQRPRPSIFTVQRIRSAGLLGLSGGRAQSGVGIEVSMTLHESNHGTQNGKNGPVH
jgi:hypothetical protein